MNLKEWANIPPKKQKALVIKWASKAGPDENPMAVYRKLAQQAAKSLKKNLKGKPYVTDVQIDCGEWYHFKSQCRSCFELVINVCTTDSNPPRLDLPATFKSFRVCQFDYGPKRDAYLKTWKRLFKELKGWNEEQTLTWVARNNWMNWMGQLKKNKQLGAGHPLEDGGKMLSGLKGKNVAAFEDDRDTIGGFMIINAKNMAEATKLAKGCPIFNNGGTVELRQAAEMSDG